MSISPRKARKKNSPSFFSYDIRTGSRGVLCTATSRCMRIDVAERSKLKRVNWVWGVCPTGKFRI